MEKVQVAGTYDMKNGNSSMCQIWICDKHKFWVAPLDVRITY
jgi:hypothetical protein